MKNDLAVFKNEQFGEIRTIDEQGKVYFCGKDVAIALGYKDSINAVKQHCRKDGVVKHHLIDSMGRKQSAIFINEGNLYRLITHSKLPEAEKFESWVFDEVLPQIRKTGKYEASDKLREQRAETAKINADTRRARELLKIADTTETAYKQVLQAYATKFLTGEFLLPLPEVEERTYSATEIAMQLGVSAHKIGSIANAHGLKTEKYGKWFYDKAKTANKQVETFRYYERTIEVFKSILSAEVVA